MRRTTTIDMVRPDGLLGPLVLSGIGRDLATGIDGEPYLIDAAATSLTVSAGVDRAVTEVVVDSTSGAGSDAPLAELIGQRAGSGFRRALAGVAPELVGGGSLVHQVLDDTPPATLIAGSVLVRAGLLSGLDRALPASATTNTVVGSPPGETSVALGGPRPRKLPVDICAGWAADGEMVKAVATTGVPLLGWGPEAPPLGSLVDGEVDPMSWHPVEDLGPKAMRRRRLIDLWRGVGPDGRTASAPVQVTVVFRDTYGDRRDESGEVGAVETVVHEYAFTARIDPSTWIVTAATAVPGPLPAPECPSAALSAERLVGRRVVDLRHWVRDEMTGTSTCTHLNDLFRSLADVRHLWESAALSRGESR